MGFKHNGPSSNGMERRLLAILTVMRGSFRTYFTCASSVDIAIFLGDMLNFGGNPLSIFGGLNFDLTQKASDPF